jgi:thymidylate synthase
MPGAQPLIPVFPEAMAIPPPVESIESVCEYFAEYLMDPELKENETYKYATWIASGVERVITQLLGFPGNNQATISLGGSVVRDGITIDVDSHIDPGTGEFDPPCLRVIDFRLDQQNILHMVVYFRSWDLWGGFPMNLAGLQMLKEYVGQAIGAEDGTIIASSKGLHLYDHCIDVASQRIGRSALVKDLESLCT